MNASFLISAAKPEQLPELTLPEIAFVGRSNVGKSSLMNRVLNQKKLVKVGKTPGKTRLINFFAVGDDLTFVDLPGYGYAEVSKAEKASWSKLIDYYLNYRENLRLCFLLIDIRRMPQEEEFMMLKFLQKREIQCCIVLTKSDKLSRNQIMNQKRIIAKELSVEQNKLITFSATTGEGKENIKEKISSVFYLDWA